MHAGVHSLYETLIERDLGAVDGAVRKFRERATSRDLFDAVARFAILSYAPGEHPRHAVTSCVAAWDLRERLGERFDEALAECARYAAASRAPWSEPPLLDPPHVEGPLAPDALASALAGKDRAAAERWLAGSMDAPGFTHQFFEAASIHAGELGDGLILSVAAWRLAHVLGAAGRYATLRIAVWEWLAHPPCEPAAGPSVRIDSKLLERVIRNAVIREGSLDALHTAMWLGAGTVAMDMHGGLDVERRIASCIAAEIDQTGGLIPKSADDGEITVYRFARDYGMLFEMLAMKERLTERSHAVSLDPLVALARHNLAQESYEEWTLA